MTIKIADAIKKINPNAQYTYQEEDIEAMIPTVEAEIEQEKQDAINKKASGKQKLKDLGLDDDEIQALMGA